MIANLQTLYKKHREVISYIFFGGLTTVINWIAYSLCITVGVSVFISNIVAWFTAVVFAFVTNKIWVFESKEWSAATLRKEGVPFLGSRLFTGALEIIFVPLLIYMGLNQAVFGIEGLFAKIVVSVVVIILNYVMSKLFVFNSEGENSA